MIKKNIVDKTKGQYTNGKIIAKKKIKNTICCLAKAQVLYTNKSKK